MAKLGAAAVAAVGQLAAEKSSRTYGGSVADVLRCLRDRSSQRPAVSDAVRQLLSGLAQSMTQKEHTVALGALGARSLWAEAVQLLAVAREGDGPDTWTCNAAVSACEKGRQWAYASLILTTMKELGPEPDVVTYNAALSACEKAGQWSRALALLTELLVAENLDGSPSRTPDADIISFNAVISACQKAGRWQAALALLSLSAERGLQLDAVTYNAAMSACETGGQWQVAVLLLQEMRQEAVERDVLSYSAAISAMSTCAIGEIVGGPWEVAFALLAEMHEEVVQVDIVAYNAAVHTCEKSIRWQPAVALLGQLQEVRIAPDVWTFSSAISACATSDTWELALWLFHTMSDMRLKPTAVTFGALMHALEQGKQWERAVALLGDMQLAAARGGPVPNDVVLNLCISACGGTAGWPCALAVFESMPRWSIPRDALAYRSAVAAVFEAGGWNPALALLQELQLFATMDVRSLAASHASHR
eukprot:TRINITY_DN35595_c2_g1_i2.p1 TRINITY_DN35595_c2_g1~~TRINITY_DN35595_c2_g1_i2.p1  ORF type:complete len:477 (-),score=114.01 TRINITY_DN35595_c2_g1_i2:142-1572(-)